MAGLLLAGAFGVTSADAATPRQAAADQYGGSPVIGSGTTPTTATTPDTPTTPSDGTTEPVSGSGGSSPDGGSGGSGDDTPSRDSDGAGTSTPGGAGAGSGSTDAADGPPGNRVASINFGKPSKKLTDDVEAAAEQAGLQILFRGDALKTRFAAFLASPLVRLLSADGVAKAGQAFGAQLVNPTPAAQRAFPALLGPRPDFVPVIRAVLSRRAGLTKDQVAFAKGVAKGLLSTDVPLAYVERSDVKQSFVTSFRKLKVLTVDDIDTPAGKLRLGQIMLGQITTQEAVDAVKVDPASAITADVDGGTGATPWLLLAVVLGGAAFMATGTTRRRRSRSAA